MSGRATYTSSVHAGRASELALHTRCLGRQRRRARLRETTQEEALARQVPGHIHTNGGADKKEGVPPTVRQKVNVSGNKALRCLERMSPDELEDNKLHLALMLRRRALLDKL